MGKYSRRIGNFYWEYTEGKTLLQGIKDKGRYKEEGILQFLSEMTGISAFI
ncbi:MAG: hypothetical protein NZ901_12150 [Geminocystis sp.]|nr:hypothetical protein [Geminocystis sp.]HIK38853.1 hypothetical protein [Geminocystis sp. M7585_C2015_104]MCS7148920.1 hypothetical protein [Geminocystis sp.]MCX8077876.1 hypothetical protein [Geminocystis sp.]MDW8117005.1 hypothetical protein [Geminocystis sp.]